MSQFCVSPFSFLSFKELRLIDLPGDFYVRTKMMFDSGMYARLLAILRQAIRNSSSTVDCQNDYVSL